MRLAVTSPAVVRYLTFGQSVPVPKRLNENWAERCKRELGAELAGPAPLWAQTLADEVWGWDDLYSIGAGAVVGAWTIWPVCRTKDACGVLIGLYGLPVGHAVDVVVGARRLAASVFALTRYGVDALCDEGNLRLAASRVYRSLLECMLPADLGKGTARAADALVSALTDELCEGVGEALAAAGVK